MPMRKFVPAIGAALLVLAACAHGVAGAHRSPHVALFSQVASVRPVAAPRLSLAAPRVRRAPRRSPLIRATTTQQSGEAPAAASAPEERSALGDKTLQRLRADLRANLAKEGESALFDSLRKSSLTRTVAIVLGVSLFAFASAPAMLELLTPLAVVTSASSTATTAVTGVFMVPLGIVFGTMTSMTANVLRQRQLNVREVFYKEVAALDALSNVLAKLFQRDPRRLRATQAAVFRYCELARTQVEPGAVMTDEVLCSFFAQRAALGTINGQLASLSDRETQTAAFNFSPAQASSDAGRAWDLVNTILQLQASRSANVEHEFPFAHFALMAALGLCLPFCFILVVLWGAPDVVCSLGLRVIYTVMCAILAAVFNFLIDMNEPFSGIYAVQPRRLRVVQAGVINFMSRADQQDAQSFDEFIRGYKTLWADPGAGGSSS